MQFRHSSPLSALAVDASGTRALTGGTDAGVWDISAETVGSRGELMAVDDERSPLAIIDLPAPCRSASFAPDGQRAAVGTEDGQVIVFDLAGGAVPLWLAPRAIPMTPRTPTRAVTGVGFAADGRSLMVARGDGRVVQHGLADGAILAEWDLEPRSRTVDDFDFGVFDLQRAASGWLAVCANHIALLEAGGAIARSREIGAGRSRLAVSRDRVLVIGEDATLLLVAPTLEILWFGPGGRDAALAEDLSTIAIAGRHDTQIVDVHRADRVIVVTAHPGACARVAWSGGDLVTAGTDGRVLRSAGAATPRGVIAQHPRGVEWLITTRDRLLSASVDGTVIVEPLIRAPAPLPLGSLRMPDRVIAMPPPIYGAHWLPDATILIVTQGTTSICHRDGTVIQCWPISGTPAISPTGRIVLASGRAVHIIDNRTGDARRIHEGWSINPTFITDDHVAITLEDRAVILDARTGEVVVSLGETRGPRILGVPATGRALVIGGHETVLVDTRTDPPRVLQRFSDHASGWHVSPDGIHVLRTSPEGFSLFSMITTTKTSTTAAVVRELAGGVRPWIATWSADSRRCAVASRTHVAVSDVENHDLFMTELSGDDEVHSIALSPDGGYLAIGSRTGDATVGQVGSERRRSLPSARDKLATVSWVADDRLLVTIQDFDDDEVAWLHESSGQLVAPLVGLRASGCERKSPVFPFARVVGTLLIMAIRDDGILRGWNLSDGAMRFEAPPTRGNLRTIELDRAGQLLLAVDDGGEVRLYDLARSD